MLFVSWQKYPVKAVMLIMPNCWIAWLLKQLNHLLKHSVTNMVIYSIMWMET